MRVRVVTWNLNHRLRAIDIGPDHMAALTGLCPDVLVLTEYVPRGVPRGERQYFRDALRECGLEHTLVSETPFEGRFNHVLVAAREPMQRGAIEPPRHLDIHIPSNALHVRLIDTGVNILGIRIPDYSTRPRVRRATWDWVTEAAAALVARPAVILGDFNTDPTYEVTRCGDRFGVMKQAGWTLAAPASGASYWTIKEKAPKRLDHAFVSPGLQVLKADYVDRLGPYALACAPGALSDHAVLAVDVGQAA